MALYRLATGTKIDALQSKKVIKKNKLKLLHTAGSHTKKRPDVTLHKISGQQSFEAPAGKVNNLDILNFLSSEKLFITSELSYCEAC